MNTQPAYQRSFNVFRYVGQVVTFCGVVRSPNHVQADRKALTLYGSGVWTKERD